MNIASIDINLIKALHLLLEEQNVSSAASKAGITQPAMSNALSRIRAIFNDQILVRTSNGMQPTILAKKLQPAVKQAILNLNDVFNIEDDFDPKHSSYTYNIAASDYSSFIIAPLLIKILEQKYPNIRVNIHKLSHDAFTKGLEDMQYDFVLGTGFKTALPESIYTKVLFQDHLACSVSKRFGAQAKTMTLKGYLSSKHIFVSPVGLKTQIVDTTLRSMGKEREIVMTLPHFSVAIHTLSYGPHILTLPNRVLTKMSKYIPIKTFELPLSLEPFDVTLSWHEKTHKSIAHKWLRNLLYEIFTNN